MSGEDDGSKDAAVKPPRKGSRRSSTDTPQALSTAKMLKLRIAGLGLSGRVFIDCLLKSEFVLNQGFQQIKRGFFNNCDMQRLSLRFYAELNDFLPPGRCQTEFRHLIDRNASVKDVIESLGVPHTEVELILVNGAPVDFSYGVRDGDRISVYPVFKSLDIRSLLRLRDKPLLIPRFVGSSRFRGVATTCSIMIPACQ